MTTIYFMRHSEVLKRNVNNNDSLQLQNEKWVLTNKGEEMANKKSQIKEFQDFDAVFSSNYVRAISTAKYFTNKKIIIDERFNERKFGINSWDELPNNFEEKQFNDFNYKIGDGESLNEVMKREEDALKDILNNYQNKKILIIGHSTAFAALLSKWCKIDYPSSYKYNDIEFFDGKWDYLETFKLEFDSNILISIKNMI